MEKYNCFVIDGRPVYLPVTPPEAAWESGVKMETINISNLGDVYRPGKPTRRRGAIESFFPASAYAWLALGAALDPYWYVNLFERLAASKKVVRYIVEGTEINAQVVVESIQHREKDASGDVYYTLRIAEWVDLEAVTVSNLDTAWDGTFGTGNGGQSVEGGAQQHTIVSGDMLSVLCRRYYGNGSATYYNALAAYNGIKNPHLIYPGTTITIRLRRSCWEGEAMECYLTNREGREITKLLPSITWSGDKASVARKLSYSILVDETTDWPVPEEGDVFTLVGETGTLFSGYVIKHSQDSEQSVSDGTCYDRGIYLRNNDGTYKFRRTTAEAMCAAVCSDYGIPVVELASTGVPLDRKFSGVRLDQIVRTAYTLASQKTGERYAFRMRPDGLEVKRMSQSESSLNLRPRSNLIRANTTKSIENMVNSVGIYDQSGHRVGTVRDQAAADLYGVMEKHITQTAKSDPQGQAAALLEDGALQQNVSVEVLGDERLITGETVVVEEERTGLTGVFWIESDQHTWKRDQYTCRLTLNCRSVMATASAGGEL